MDLKLLVDMANIVVTIGVIFAITQININRKQLHLSTIARCINEFRNLNIDYSTKEESAIVRYIDLVNEELFYFQHQYLPKVIAFEWLDGMLDFVPVVDNRGNILNVGYCIEEFARNRDRFLINYPRLQTTFTVRQNFDEAIIYSKEKKDFDIRALTRKAIVEELYQNVLNSVF